jgi:hypothetical protein
MKYTFSLFVILLSLSFTQDRSVVITGTCLLEVQTDHSGTAVEFQADPAPLRTILSTQMRMVRVCNFT